MFASQVGRAWGAEFIAGVNAAAEEHDINLVHFIGGKLTPIVTDDQNKLSFGLYDLAKPGLLDGLLLTADVAHGVSPEHLKTFSDFTAPSQSSHSQYRWMALRCSSPTMSRGCACRGRHLIEEHGYKRIAFIRGIRGQIDAEQRSQAYQDELKAHNLHVDQNLVVHGDYTPESGTAAIRTLLDERRLRFRAVVAANDSMAFGALEALQQRACVPEDVAVTGFDDTRSPGDRCTLDHGQAIVLHTAGKRAGDIAQAPQRLPPLYPSR